jgi:hypothetical protein
MALSLGATACGGGGEDATDTPSSTPSTTSATPTPTPTTTATPAAEPLSVFEDRPEVVSLRAWAVAQSQDINHGDRQMPRAAQLETPHGRQVVPGYAAGDMGLYYPGPLPFTPVAVKSSGGKATISTCWWSEGWAQDKASHKPARKKQVVPAIVQMRRTGGRWLLDDVTPGSADCHGVKVKGVRW